MKQRGAIVGITLPAHVADDRELRVACNIFRQRIRKSTIQGEGEMFQTASEILDDITEDERKRFSRELIGTRLYDDLVGNVRIVFGP